MGNLDIYNNKLHDLYRALDTVKSTELQKGMIGRSCSLDGEDKKCIQNFFGQTSWEVATKELM